MEKNIINGKFKSNDLLFICIGDIIFKLSFGDDFYWNVNI